MGSDWDEIRKLAADLQTIQLQTTTQKLSDRNCIEIVNYLQKTGRLKLIFTTDGKEYVTIDCLKREILDELASSSNGRLTITEIANSLVVDPIHVRKCANDLVMQSQQTNRLQPQRKLLLLNDSLIGQRYFVKIANEIRDSILDRGIVQLNDIVMKWDLPRDIIERNILPFVSNIIVDSYDPNILYNSCYLNRLQCLMRGYLFAVTAPVRFDVICAKIAPNFANDKLLMSLALKIDPLPGSFDNGVFMPRVYLKTMAENVQSFMNQNRYITLDNMSRFGVKNPKKFLKSLQLNEPFVFLASCIVSKRLLDTLVVDFDECRRANNWYFDLDQLLPCPMSAKDFEMIRDDFLFDRDDTSTRSTVIQIGRFLVTKGLMAELRTECMKLVTINVEKIVNSGEYQNHLINVRLQCDKDDYMADKKNRKSSKKKPSTVPTKLLYVNETDVCQAIDQFRAAAASRLLDSDQNLFDLHTNDLIPLLIDDLQTEASKLAALKYEEMVRVMEQQSTVVETAANASTAHNSSLADRKKQIRELENDLNEHVCRFRLMDKGLGHLPTTNSDLKQQLSKHLLRTSGSELLVKLAALVEMKFSAKNRIVTAQRSMDETLKSLADTATESETITKLLRLRDLDEFNATFRTVCQLGGINVQKTDRKKERLIVRETRAVLVRELEVSEAPDSVLVVACQLIFLTFCSGSLLSFGGKFVRGLLEVFVQLEFLDAAMQSLMFSYCDAVSKYLNAANNNTDSADTLATVQKQMPAIKTAIRDLITSRKPHENPEIDDK